MKTLKTIIIFTFLTIFGLLQATNIQTKTIYFKTAKHTIENTETSKLNDISKANKFYLIGHTDSDGDNEYNQQLSKKRVTEVFNYLLSKGINKDKIDIKYFGETKPTNKNKDFEEKSKNRRVEIKYIIDPLMDFEIENQHFVIKDNKKTVIKGNQGTLITFDANTFKEKNVHIELKEYYETLDILSANLSTRANDKLLETSGMIKIEAYSNGKKVEPLKEFEIKFKKMSKSEGFELFEGNIKNNLDVNWKQMNESIAKIVDLEVSETVLDWSISTRTSPMNYISDSGTYTWQTKSGKDIVWKNWSQVFDYIDLINLKNRTCFTNSRMKISLDKNGQYTDIMTSHESTKPYCDALLKNSLTDRIVVDKLTENSQIDLTFKMSFERMDSMETYYNKLEKERNRLALIRFDSINDYDKKNMTASQQQKIETINKIKKTKLVQYEINNIVTYSKSFGWINCDRFRQNLPKTDFVVKVSTDMNVRMVSKKFNSFYNGHNDSQNENRKVFTGIPIGEKVTLICTTYKNDEIFVAIENTSISKQAFGDFKFKKVTKDELREMVAEI